MLNKIRQQLNKIHNFYLKKFKFYRTWHEQPNSKKIHKVTLALFALFALTSALYIMPFSPFRAKAAGTYYVSATGTNPWSSCTNKSNPCSIMTANTNAVGGDTIVILPGIYTPRVNWTADGTSGNPINITKEPSGSAPILTLGIAIEGEYVDISGFQIGTLSTAFSPNWFPQSGDFALAITGSYNHVHDFSMPDMAVEGSFLGVLGTAHNNIVDAFTVTDIPRGVVYFHETTYSNTLGGGDSYTPNSYVKGYGGQPAIYLWGENNNIGGLDINGFGNQHKGVGWKNMDDGDVIQWTGTHNSKVENMVVRNIWPAFDNAHCDGIQTWNGGHGNNKKLTVQNSIWGSRSVAPNYPDIASNYRGKPDLPQPLMVANDFEGSTINVDYKNNIVLGGDGYWLQYNSVGTNSIVNANILNNTLMTDANAYTGTRLRGDFKNNIINFDNGSGDPGGFNWDYNLYTSSGIGTFGDTHKVVGNPLFVNGATGSETNYGVTADWHLTASSPARGAGVGGVDIGAFKYVSNHYVSEAGTANWANCTVVGTPCSVTTANDNYSAGDYIYLVGNFSNRITFSRSGSSASHVKIEPASGRTIFTRGLTLSGSYLEISKFDIGAMNSSDSAGTFMINISGNYNIVTDFRAGNDGSNGLATLLGGSLVGFTGIANNNRASDFEATDVPWCGAEFQPNSHDNILGGNYGIRDSYIHGFGDNVAIGNQDGTNNWINGGNGWLDITGEGYAHDAGGWKSPSSNDGDGVKPYGTNNGLKKVRIYKLFQVGPSSHTDGVQVQGDVPSGSVGVQNYIIENSVFGSYSRSRPTSYVPNQPDMPNQFLMLASSSPANSSITVRNSIFLGQNADTTVIQFNSSNYPKTLTLNLYNNTFYCDYTPVGTYNTQGFLGEAYNNIFMGSQQNWTGQGEGDINWHHNLYPQASYAVGTNNVIAVNPFFVNANMSESTNYGIDADFHLQSNSPAIGAGENGSDIGAFPYQGSGGGTCTIGNGDVNGDTHVNISDAAILMAKWNQNVTNDPADVNCSGKVDISDAAILMSRWGT